MRSLFTSLFLCSTTLLAACDKPPAPPAAAADPAYLKGIEDMATEACACAGKPDALECAMAALKKAPKPPGGQSAAEYEKIFSEAERTKLGADRSRAMKCARPKM